MNKIFQKKAILLLIGISIIGWAIFLRPSEKIDFSTQVKPILNKHCISCHGGVKKNGGFSLLFEKEALAETESGHPAIIPGKAHQSAFIQRLKSNDPEIRMPYQKPPLSKAEIKILEQWVNQGAQWGKHWAYDPVAAVAPPLSNQWADVSNATENQNRHEIDAFIQTQLEEINLKPAAKAAPHTLIRRLALDLTGLPPDPELAQKFVQGAMSYEAAIDSLLNDVNFGEKWAAWWLDLARYADTKGYEKDPSRIMWRYRDYVIKSFNNNKPFDQFTIEQLAGDLLPNPTDEQWIATAFHRNTMNNTEGGTDNEEFRVAAVLDRVNTTFEVWQSTTFACVQCHSHPYDPFTHEEYYKMVAFFNNTRDEDTNGSEPNLRIYTEEEQEQFDKVKNWIAQHADEKRLAEELVFIKTLEPKIDAHHFSNYFNGEMVSTSYVGLRHNGHCELPNVVLHGEDEIVLQYRGWKEGGILKFRANDKNGKILTTIRITDTKGTIIKRFPFEPLEGQHTVYLEFSNPNLGPQENSFYIEWVAFHKSLPGKNKAEFPAIEKQFLALVEKPKELLPVMVENPIYRQRTTQVFERGNWMSLGDTVSPGVPQSLNKFPTDQPQNRLGLAHWLVDPQNPLTSRTLVNRIWEQIFGQGLVTTLEDMGTQSDLPIHKELLDYLSYELIHTYKWDIKALIKFIVSSETYQQDSRTPVEVRALDPYNRYFSRGPRFRLSAEQIRDQVLAVSDLLSDKMYGPSVMPPQPEGIWQTVYSGEKWVTSEGEDRYRRGLYTFMKRTSPYPSFISFDAGSREICQVQRLRTNTPLQALVTLNDPVYLEAAIYMAQQLLKDTQEVPLAIKSAYEKATFQLMSDETEEILIELYQDYYQHFSDSEQNILAFLSYTDKEVESTPKMAAMAMVCNAIMNLDEFLTKS